MAKKLRLGVNIDHVATIRNARGGTHPDPLRAAKMAAKAGADGITAHLREDRRHMTDNDIDRLSQAIDLPLNLEIAATDEMLAIALRHLPHAACIVPERRVERTTEGGLNVADNQEHLRRFVDQLGGAGIRVSMFIEAEPRQLEAAHALGVPVVELHTGAYCDASDNTRQVHLDRIRQGAHDADVLGLECHAGHGLGYDSIGPIACITNIVELNIGHFLIGEAIFDGLDSAIRRMRTTMNTARAETGSKQHE